MKHHFLGTRFHFDKVYRENPIELNTMKLTQIGELWLESGFEIGEHPQHCYEISYIISGKGCFYHNNLATDVSAGDIIITPKTGTHSITSSENDEIYYSYIGFNFTESDSELKKRVQNFLCDGIQIKSEVPRDIYVAFKNCIAEFYNNKSYDKLLIEAYITQIILQSCKNFSSEDSVAPTSENETRYGLTVYLIMKYIDRNIEKPLSVSGIASSLGYSTYHISHLFKSKMHITLQEYICNKKIEKAKEMMGRNRFTISEISEKLSFLNIQSFSRSFKRITGMPPSVYAAKLKQKNP
ncbi:MAG: helix-turn-helix domain-containing protein [Ruminococcaceae bacterium]|nr:helix-turn-helix domain-containing protein [Oscillospiraceae bacterium]